ncbi:response regulator [Spiribacter salinus M19-40]|uniref:Response regulator n=1 Tax=Spiribacter salinus M19-40 TaxID=1260251 RepID=R4VLL7_9GAMM|nr:response regulator transcription factor [Spiribacter salinus]AGM40508.1 response regulator [Spiribacter salinus M19-40]
MQVVDSKEPPLGVTRPDRLLQIAILEDIQVIQDRFKSIIEQSDLASQVALAESNEQLEQLLNEGPLDVVLADLGLPDGSGLVSIQRVCALYPQCQVIVVSSLSDPETVTTALVMGAVGYIQKDDASIEVVEAIKQALSGGSPISASIARKIVEKMQFQPQLADPDADHGLTEREIEVLTVLSKGLSQAESAKALSMARTTLPVHVRNIYRKLQAHNRTEAIFEARNQGIIP